MPLPLKFPVLNTGLLLLLLLEAMAFSSPALLALVLPLPYALHSSLHLILSALLCPRLPSRLLQQLLQLLVHWGATSCCCCCNALLAPDTMGMVVGTADGMELLVLLLLLLLVPLASEGAGVTCGV